MPSAKDYMNQSIGNSLRALNFSHPPRNEEEARFRVDTALQTAAYAARAAIHTTLKTSPGSMAFHRDMVLNIPLIVDFELLRQRRQILIDRNLAKANASRIDHNYQPGDLCYKRVPDPKKLDPKWEGPFSIDRIYTNGTVDLRLSPNVTERVNLRHIKPKR